MAKNIKQFAAQLREDYGPDPRSDEQLVSDYLKKHPEDLSEVNRSAPRPDTRASGTMRFLQGTVAAPVEAVTGTVKGAFEAGKSGDPKQMADVAAGMMRPMPGAPSLADVMHPPTGEQSKQNLLGMVDLPGISKDIAGGGEGRTNWPGAAGRSLTQALMIASMLKGSGLLGKTMTGPEAMESMGTIGKGLKVGEANLDAAKAATSVPSKFLSAEIDAMKDGLKGQWVDVKSLRQSLAKPTKMIKDIERAPGVQVKDISAAKDVVARLQDRVNRGMMPWPEAQEALKEIRHAAANTRGASALRSSLNETADALETSVVDGAKKGGYGKAYEQWQKNYRDLSNLQRAHAKITGGTTQSQLEAGATKGPGVGIPRTGLKIGGRSVTKAGKTQLKNWNIALKELHRRIGIPKGATGPKPPGPSAPPPPAPPAGGGGAAPAPPSVTPPPPQGAKTTFYQPQPSPKGFGTAGAGTTQAAPANPFDAAAYQNAPKTLGQTGGQGGANYSAEDLAKFKEAHGIKDDF